MPTTIEFKPVDQTVFETGRGNSLASCLASLVGCPVDHVPDIDRGLDTDAMGAWLIARGYGFAWMQGDLTVFYLNSWLHPYCVVIGPSPRDPAATHAVVGKITFEGPECGIEIVHDPHPTRAGVNPPWCSIIVLFDWEAMCDRWYPPKDKK